MMSAANGHKVKEVFMTTVWHLYFAGLHFREFCEIGGVREMKFLNRKLKGIITRAPEAARACQA